MNMYLIAYFAVGLVVTLFTETAVMISVVNPFESSQDFEGLVVEELHDCEEAGCLEDRSGEDTALRVVNILAWPAVLLYLATAVAFDLLRRHRRR